MATSRLLIFDSHPVQYKAPVYREIAQRIGDDLLVVYGSDCTVRGHNDPGFGQKVVWDVPLLTGYNYRILNCDHGKPLDGYFSLHSWIVYSVIQEYRPTMVLLSQLNYIYDLQVALSAWVLGVPVYFRVETQDEAHERSAFKSFLRSIVWRGVYSLFTGAFWIGRLNRRHLIAHGFLHKPLPYAPYCVDGELMELTESEATSRRGLKREQVGIGPATVCVGFFGKLIPKKDPMLILLMAQLMTDAERVRFHFIFVGSGALESELKLFAKSAGLRCTFTGFINQKEITDYYLATDIVMLPSKRMGETWGLVVNEALAAGCSVIVTDAVGSHAEFGHLGEVEVIPVGSSARAIEACRKLAVGFPMEKRSRKLPMIYNKKFAADQIIGEVNQRLNIL